MGSDKFAGKARKKITKKRRTMKKKRTMKKRGATKRRRTTKKRRTTKRQRTTKKRKATKRRRTKKQKGGSDFGPNGPIRTVNPIREQRLEEARYFVQFLKTPLVEQFKFTSPEGGPAFDKIDDALLAWWKKLDRDQNDKKKNPFGIMYLFNNWIKTHTYSVVQPWYDYYIQQHTEANRRPEVSHVEPHHRLQMRGNNLQIPTNTGRQSDSDEDDSDFDDFEIESKRTSGRNEEKVEQIASDEQLLNRRHANALQRRLQELHPYESRLNFFSDSDSDDDRGEGKSGDDFPDPRTFDSDSDVDWNYFSGDDD